ncbi:hypothetical protein H2204_001225 [Knufia peltigerae]|uniref:Uncharacterized protein n=1 Tax=Knufia peltigerae TaxID=1002370 RepID=A0AA38YDW3_9EURO|nr:hypothetical protein H2204_001225 [Knufia peltigerae]
MHIQNIPREHVPTLTKILQFPPDVDVREHVKSLAGLIKPLPYTLRTSRVERVILRQQGNLCGLHNFLDHETVETVLSKIKVEIGPRLNSLVSQCQLLTPGQRKCVTELQRLHALWTPRREFEMTFICCADDIKWKYEASQCEACIVSRIAGDLQTMLNLRCMVRSRATSKHVAKHGLPRLQVWIESWIQQLHQYLAAKTGQVVDLEQDIIEENEKAAVALKVARSKIHEFRVKQNGIVHVNSLRHGEHGGQIGHSTAPPQPPPANANGNVDGDIDGDSDSDVSADPSSKGHSPYGGRMSLKRAKAETVYSVDIENLEGGPSVSKSRQSETERGRGQEQELEEVQGPYIPPRQNWKREAVPTAKPSLTAQSNPPAAPVCNDSWYTEPLTSSQVSRAPSTTLYLRPQQAQAAATPAAQSHPIQDAGGPAETYENLIGSFPTDSVIEDIEPNRGERSSECGPKPTVETLPRTTYDPHSHSNTRASSTAIYTHTMVSDTTFKNLGQGSAATTAIFILDDGSEPRAVSSSSSSAPSRQPSQPSDDTCSSRWEDFYESQARLRDDLNWFYHRKNS